MEKETQKVQNFPSFHSFDQKPNRPRLKNKPTNLLEALDGLANTFAHFRQLLGTKY